MLIKIIIICLLAIMIYNLFKAMRLMTQNNPENKEHMSKYIGRRVLISVLIVVLLIVGILTGVIIPNPPPLQ